MHESFHHDDSKQNRCAREATKHPSSSFKISALCLIQLFLICCIHQERTYSITLPYVKLALFSVNTSHLKILSSGLWHVNSHSFLHVTSISDKDQTVYIIFSHTWITKEEIQTFQEQEKGEKRNPCLLGFQNTCLPFLICVGAKCATIYIHAYVYSFISIVYTLLSPH